MTMAVWIDSVPYREECTRGPHYQRPVYELRPLGTATIEVKPLTEVDVRHSVLDPLGKWSTVVYGRMGARHPSRCHGVARHVLVRVPGL